MLSVFLSDLWHSSRSWSVLMVQAKTRFLAISLPQDIERQSGTQDLDNGSNLILWRSCTGLYTRHLFAESVSSRCDPNLVRGRFNGSSHGVIIPWKMLTGIASIGLWGYGRLKGRANSARHHNRLDVSSSCVSLLSDAGESSRSLASTRKHLPLCSIV